MERAAATPARAASPAREKLRRALLGCGILSPVLYVGTDILAASIYPGYSYIDQQVSELSAIGAPTAKLWLAMTVLWTTLVVAFAAGVWLSAGSKRSLRVTSVLLASWGIVGLLWVLFAPMHVRGSAALGGDLPHIVFAGVQVLTLMLFIAFGSGAAGRGFRIYSIVTIVADLVFGALPGTQAARIAAGLPTPGWGLIERVAVYAPMVWLVVFAVVLLRASQPGVRGPEEVTA